MIHWYLAIAGARSHTPGGHPGFGNQTVQTKHPKIIDGKGRLSQDMASSSMKVWENLMLTPEISKKQIVLLSSWAQSD